MFGRIGSALAAALVVLGVVGWTPVADPMSLLPSSQLWVEGKSTLRDWKCKAGELQATISANGNDAVAQILAGEKAVQGVDLTVPIAKMDCSNGTMNEHMRKALKSKDNPTITFKLDSYELRNAEEARKGTLNGGLTIGGVTKPIVMEVHFAKAPNGDLRVTGTHTLQMTIYGIKPPALMLGTMKVKDQVTVGFDLVLNR